MHEFGVLFGRPLTNILSTHGNDCRSVLEFLGFKGVVDGFGEMQENHEKLLLTAQMPFRSNMGLCRDVDVRTWLLFLQLPALNPKP